MTRKFPLAKAGTAFLTLVILPALLSCAPQHVRAQAAAPLHNWDAQWQYLLGTWASADGHGVVGSGGGKFTFSYDLQRKLIVRRNHADYPGANGRPAVSHDDLMVVYADAATHGIAADYFDDEGHVIHYIASESADGKTLVLISPAAANQPRYRLTYTRLGQNHLSSAFEVATPGHPDAFQTYVQGTASRQR